MAAPLLQYLVFPPHLCVRPSNLCPRSHRPVSSSSEEERPERNDVRKPHRACCPQSMADRNQPINWGNLIFSRDRDQCLLRFFVNLSKPTNIACACHNTGKLEMYANFLRYSGLQSYKWSLPYLIIVADAADAVSVNFSGRCKFLQI